MRSIWLASAAVILSAGVACAQTSMSSPAPTGSPNAPTETPTGASPGNMGTGNSSGSTSMSQMMPVAGTPAPTGAPQSPQEVTPGHSPGNTAPPPPMTAGSSSSTSNGSTGDSTTGAPPVTHTSMSHTSMSHGMSGHMTIPASASADRYLHIAADAIKHHNKMLADEALGHAETRLLTRAVPATDTAPDHSPRVEAIEHARQALASGDYQSAAMDTHQAMHMHGEMMSSGGAMGSGAMGGSMGSNAGGMSGPSTTTDTPMNGSPMSNESASGTSAGNGK